MRRADRISIQKHSHEWKDVAFQIQLATGCASIKMLNVQRYPILVERSVNDPSIRGIVDTTALKRKFKEMVIEKQIPLDDVIFICGHINLESYHSQRNKVFNFLLCEVALGAIACTQEAFKYADSMLIEPDSGDPYHYNFLLKSYKQYQVKYECQFMIEDPIDLGNLVPNCCLCSSINTTIYCRDEQKYFCGSCSDSHHLGYQNGKGNQIPRGHILEPISRKNTLPMCEVHNLRHEGFCTKCEKYVCAGCIQQPPHHQNDVHPTRPIEYLYEEKKQANSRLPIKPKEKLTKLLQMAKEKQDNVMENYHEVKSAIVAEFDKAMADLERMHQQRHYLVESDVLRIQMEIDRLEWNVTFLTVQEQTFKPIHYFRLQSRFEEEIKQIKTSGFYAIEIPSDIDQYSLIRVADKKTISELKHSLSKKQEDWHANSNAVNKERSQEIKRRSERLLTYNPEGDPPRKGDLTLLLQNNKTNFFKVKHLSS